MPKTTPKHRDSTIIRLRQEGKKLVEIASIFNISKGRVWQIVNDYRRYPQDN